MLLPLTYRFGFLLVSNIVRTGLSIMIEEVEIHRRRRRKQREAMTSRYWVVSLPVKDSSSSLWNRLQEQISKHSFDTPVYRVRSNFQQRSRDYDLILISISQFNIPNLRVGTLDSLLALGDDLLKVIFRVFIS